MRKIICITICICSLSFQACKKEIHPYSILPEPQQIEYIAGTFEINDQLTIAFPNELTNEAELMSAYFAGDFAIQPLLKEGNEKANVTLSLDAAVLPEHQEGYILNIKPKGITIKANAPAGILHGIQTLRQLVYSENGNLLVQTGVITDYPTLGWRAFMLDEARHFKGKEVVFRLLDNMSQLKMNIFHWHLVDDSGWRIEIKKYPELTEIGAFRDSTELITWRSNVFDGKPHGGFYTQDEIKEVVEYASARHITVVPEIEMPGHATAAIASYPWLGTTEKKIKVSCDFASLDIFNVTDTNVIDFFHDVLTEVMALFPSKVIHIGGDEVNYDFWKNSPSIEKYMKENGIQTPADLQVNFTNQMSQWIESKGRRMMGWTEITGAKIHHWQTAEDNITEQHLAKSAIVHFWQGDSALIKKTIEDGYNVVNSYHLFTYLDYGYDRISLQTAYSFNPIPEGLTAEQQKRVLGLGCQMWSEWVPDEQNLNGKVYPRIAAYAESGWTNPEKKEYSRFLKALDYFLTSWEQQGIEYGPVTE